MELSISIHALLAESDSGKLTFTKTVVLISIHALLAESDVAILYLLSVVAYFYPRSPCGERRNVRPDNHQPYAISIHALLAESDVMYALIITNLMLFLSTLSLRRATGVSSVINNVIDNFYPRSPCGERPRAFPNSQAKLQFLSTLSLRRATLYYLIPRSGTFNFYPRSPCGERRP